MDGIVSVQTQQEDGMTSSVGVLSELQLLLIGGGVGEIAVG